MLTATAPTARQLQRRLHAHGICANRVTKQRNGDYVVSFTAPDVTNFHCTGIERAIVYKQQIEAAFADFHAVTWYDNPALWRPGAPVLFAAVVVRVGGMPLATGGTE